LIGGCRRLFFVAAAATVVVGEEEEKPQSCRHIATIRLNYRRIFPDIESGRS